MSCCRLVSFISYTTLLEHYRICWLLVSVRSSYCLHSDRFQYDQRFELLTLSYSHFSPALLFARCKHARPRQAIPPGVLSPHNDNCYLSFRTRPPDLLTWYPSPVQVAHYSYPGLHHSHDPHPSRTWWRNRRSLPHSLYRHLFLAILRTNLA